MSAGVYMNNGVLAYTQNLEKKLKRRKDAIVIETYQGTLTGDDLEKELQRMLDKHNNITKVEVETEDKPLKYHWRNKVTGWTHHSIYPHMNNIPGINKEEWMNSVEKMSYLAYEDQSSPANPRVPIVEDIKNILIEAFDSKEFM